MACLEMKKKQTKTNVDTWQNNVGLKHLHAKEINKIYMELKKEKM